MSIASLLVFPFIICLSAQAQNDVTSEGLVKTPQATEELEPSSPVEAEAEQEEEVATTSLTIGADLYYGRSNLGGVKRLRDGFWANGAGPVDPSTVYLGLKTASGTEGKIALGVGRLYSDDWSTLKQPHEAWYRAPVGGVNLTIGKYYVPFALQEWQSETRWGLMAEGERGNSEWAASVNYNEETHKPNAYLRLGRNLSESLNIGVSLGIGEGLSYGSTHNRAAGLDVSASAKGWNLSGEFLWMQDRESERFDFRWIKLEYEKFGKLKPFIAHARWSDSTDNFGKFSSNSVGASYEIRPDFAIEGGYSRTSQSNVKWLQLHWTPERTLWKKSGRSNQDKAQAALLPGMPQQILPRSAS